MIEIEYKEKLDEEIYTMIDVEFNKFATKNGVVCNYKSFAFVAKEDNKIIWKKQDNVIKHIEEMEKNNADVTIGYHCRIYSANTIFKY